STLNIKNRKIYTINIIDSNISFTIMIAICSLILPIILQLNYSFKNKLDYINMKRVMLLTLKHNDQKDLNKGVKIADYEIKLDNYKICIKSKDYLNEKCYYK